MEKERRRRRRVVVPRPDRVRRIEEVAFGWLDARLFREGWLEVLSPEDVAVYVFLCLAADRQGISWWRRDRVGRVLGLDDRQVRQALGRLYDFDLLAYRPFGPHASDGFHQVLSVRPGGPPRPEIPMDILGRGNR